MPGLAPIVFLTLTIKTMVLWEDGTRESFVEVHPVQFLKQEYCEGTGRSIAEDIEASYEDEPVKAVIVQPLCSVSVVSGIPN